MKKPWRGHSYEYDGKTWFDGRAESSDEDEEMDRGKEDLDLGSRKHAAAKEKLAETRLSLKEAQAALEERPLDAGGLELVRTLKEEERHFKRRAYHFSDYACSGCYAARFADELKEKEGGGDQGVEKKKCYKCDQRFCTTCFTQAARTPFPDCPEDHGKYCIECWEWMRDKPMRRERAQAEFDEGAASLEVAEEALEEAQQVVDELRVFSCEGCYFLRNPPDSDDEWMDGGSWTCGRCSDEYCLHCGAEQACRCYDSGVCKECCEGYGHDVDQ